MVEVNSETDFVARNDHFQGLVKMIADVALNAGSEDIEAIKAAKAGSMTVADAIVVGDRHDRREHHAAPRRRAVGRRRAWSRAMCTTRCRTGSARSACWSRSNRPAMPVNLPRIGRQVAMHIASANPLAIDASGVDPAVVKREKDILADKFRQQGKPEAMIEKITESGLKTFYKEQTLLEQPFIFDDKKSVAQALKEAEGKVGGPIKVTRFARFALGEGIEKATSDFAAEVAAAGGTT